MNGEAIYGTRPWHKFGEGGWRFTRKASVLYAIGAAPEGSVRLASLGKDAGRITKIEQIGNRAKLRFMQDADGLIVHGVTPAAGGLPVALKITGVAQ